jgi:RNA polymerase sigma-70 factor (ECF subfamily)
LESESLAEALERDLQLLAGLRDGDRVAATALVARMSPVVRRTVFRMTGWHSETDDLVQEVFLSIQKSAKSFRGDSQLETWVIGIAIRVCRSWQRTDFRNPKLGSPATAAEPVSLPSENDYVESVDEVRVLLASLSQSDRELVVLRYLEEMNLNDISKLLGLKKNTVEVRLHRIRERLIQSHAEKI